MAMAVLVKVILGSIAFTVFWVMAVFPAVPFLPVGRTVGSLLGAVLMVIFQVITLAEAYDSIDLSILGLLFGTMIVGIYLERADAFKYLGKLLSWKCRGAKDLICRICLTSAISSALYTNDTSCMVLTEFVLKTSMKHNLPPHPFLLALVSSANIGSSLTPIGNPQNLVIAVQSNISFLDFVLGMSLAVLAGLFVNALIIICIYWSLLSIYKKEEDTAVFPEVVAEDTATMSQALSLRYQAIRSSDDQSEISRVPSGSLESYSTRTSNESMKWKMLLWKSCVYFVSIGMLISLLMGLNMSWTAIAAAVSLMVLDFKDAQPSLGKVSYSILVFFCRMFITVEGFDKTGIPGALWDFMEPYAQINNVSGIAVLACVILVLSNLISNLPTGYEKKAWLILAWVSGVAGNLTLLGSAANLIVCEQARRSPPLGYNLTFWNHLKFGVCSTLLVTAIGLTLIR